MSEQQEKRPFDELATELLSFLGIKAEEDSLYPYKLQRANTFLEMKFGHVASLQKEVEHLRRWKQDTMPMMVRWSETHGGFGPKDDE